MRVGEIEMNQQMMTLVKTAIDNNIRSGGKVVALVRHGEKDGDRLTIEGARQMWATALMLLDLLPTEKIKEVVSSPFRRTSQGAALISACMGIDEGGVITWLDPMPHLKKAFGSDIKGQEALAPAIRAAGGTVGDAISLSKEGEVSDCIMLMRGALMDGMATYSKQPSTRPISIGVGHSEFIELAATKPHEVPYLVGLASVMIYLHDRDMNLVDSFYLECPLLRQA